MVINKRIKAVEASVPRRSDIGLHEPHRDVAIGMSRRIAFEREFLAIEVDGVFVRENDCRRSTGLRRRENSVEGRDLLKCAEPFSSIHVPDDRCSGCVHPPVAVCVMKVPVEQLARESSSRLRVTRRSVWCRNQQRTDYTNSILTNDI